MKNLLIFTRHDRRFSHESKVLVKVQIDNSIDLGWKIEDILLFTNFPFNYKGVKSRIIPDLSYKPDRTNKIPAIVYLLQNKLLADEVIWYHDFDAYQDGYLYPSLDKYDIGFVGYGYKPQYNCGSFFFRLRAQDIFEFWNSRITPRNRADEKALTDLTRAGEIDRTRYKDLNLTYNYGQRLPGFPSLDHLINKPIKVFHFHPNYRYYRSPLNNQELFKPLISKRLLSIFNKHEIF